MSGKRNGKTSISKPVKNVVVRRMPRPVTLPSMRAEARREPLLDTNLSRDVIESHVGNATFAVAQRFSSTSYAVEPQQNAETDWPRGEGSSVPLPNSAAGSRLRDMRPSWLKSPSSYTSARIPQSRQPPLPPLPPVKTYASVTQPVPVAGNGSGTSPSARTIGPSSPPFYGKREVMVRPPFLHHSPPLSHWDKSSSSNTVGSEDSNEEIKSTVVDSDLEKKKEDQVSTTTPNRRSMFGEPPQILVASLKAPEARNMPLKAANNGRGGGRTARHSLWDDWREVEPGFTKESEAEEIIARPPRPIRDQHQVTSATTTLTTGEGIVTADTTKTSASAPLRTSAAMPKASCGDQSAREREVRVDVALPAGDLHAKPFVEGANESVAAFFRRFAENRSREQEVHFPELDLELPELEPQLPLTDASNIFFGEPPEVPPGFEGSSRRPVSELLEEDQSLLSNRRRGMVATTVKNPSGGSSFADGSGGWPLPTSTANYSTPVITDVNRIWAPNTANCTLFGDSKKVFRCCCDHRYDHTSLPHCPDQTCERVDLDAAVCSLRERMRDALSVARTPLADRRATPSNVRPFATTPTSAITTNPSTSCSESDRCLRVGSTRADIHPSSATTALTTSDGGLLAAFGELPTSGNPLSVYEQRPGLGGRQPWVDGTANGNGAPCAKVIGSGMACCCGTTCGRNAGESGFLSAELGTPTGRGILSALHLAPFGGGNCGATAVTPRSSSNLLRVNQQSECPFSTPSPSLYTTKSMRSCAVHHAACPVHHSAAVDVLSFSELTQLSAAHLSGSQPFWPLQQQQQQTSRELPPTRQFGCPSGFFSTLNAAPEARPRGCLDRSAEMVAAQMSSSPDVTFRQPSAYGSTRLLRQVLPEDGNEVSQYGVGPCFLSTEMMPSSGARLPYGSPAGVALQRSSSAPGVQRPPRPPQGSASPIVEPLLGFGRQFWDTEGCDF